VLRLRIDVALEHLIAHGHAGGHPPIPAGGGDAIARESAFEVMEHRVAEGGDGRG
jgi:hypothetical protein